MSEKAIAAKQVIVDDLKEKIARSSVIAVSDYHGYSVKDLTTLRKRLRAEGSDFCVAKNTLIERAVKESGFPDLVAGLRGSTAILFGYQEAVGPLKILFKFIKEAEKGDVRVGVVDKNVYDRGSLEAISKLPSREQLIGQVVGGFKSPLFGLVNVLQGPIRKLAYALVAIRKQKGGE
ncbi:MAG: 50S ribosomal protein L10 [Candidatus Margulisiibacteriota bacterium]